MGNSKFHNLLNKSFFQRIVYLIMLLLLVFSLFINDNYKILLNYSSLKIPYVVFYLFFSSLLSLQIIRNSKTGWLLILLLYIYYFFWCVYELIIVPKDLKIKSLSDHIFHCLFFLFLILGFIFLYNIKPWSKFHGNTRKIDSL